MATSAPANPQNTIDLTNTDDEEETPQITGYSTLRQRRPQRSGGRGPSAARPPNFGRDIIDLDADEEPNNSQRNDRRRPSPDIELLWSRPRDSVGLRPAMRVPDALRGPLHSQDHAATDTGEDNYMDGLLRRHGRGEVGPREVEMYRSLTRNVLTRRPGYQMRAPADPNFQPRIHSHLLASASRYGRSLLQEGMNYTNAAFPLHPRPPTLQSVVEAPPRPPSPPPYPPLEPVADGFTRTPKEGEPLVCPNCKDELATGESEIKRRIYIVTSCGHVYCGECAENRTKSSRQKGKSAASSLSLAAAAKSQPFANCVVEGCGKTVRGKATMKQVFL